MLLLVLVLLPVCYTMTIPLPLPASSGRILARSRRLSSSCRAPRAASASAASPPLVLAAAAIAARVSAVDCSNVLTCALRYAFTGSISASPGRAPRPPWIGLTRQF